MRLLLPLMFLLFTFLFLTPTKVEAGNATILGRVYKEGPDTSNLYERRHYYGDDCGSGEGFGPSNYTIYWTQNGVTRSITNNSCFGTSNSGISRPRFTFEDTDNPDPGPVTIRVVMDDPNVLLTGFEGWTTDDGNNMLPGSFEKVTFAKRGSDQTFTRTVRDTNGSHWNHTALYWYVNNSSCQSISVSKTTLSPGEDFTANVQMLNNGTTTWSAGAQHRLGSRHNPDNIFGSNRVNLLRDVGPNSLYDFSFNAKAPTNPGTYEFKWQMVQDSVEWFGPVCRSITIAVNNPQVQNILAPIADCSISPTTINQNQSAVWSITNVRRGDGQNYIYRWYGDDGLSGNSTSVTKTYTTTGTKKAYVDITSAGFTTTIKFDNTSGAHCSPLTVNQAVPELKISCSNPLPASGQLETQFLLNSSASGGNGKYIYYWNIQEPNRNPRLIGGTASSGGIPWTPTTEGTTTASATVYSAGQSASCEVSFNVRGHVLSSFSPGTVTSYCSGVNSPKMDLTWYASKYATSYKIDRWAFVNDEIKFEKTITTIPSNPYIQSLAEKNNSFTYPYWITDSSAPLSPNIYYFYKVTASNDYGISEIYVLGSRGISCPAPEIDLKVDKSDGPTLKYLGQQSPEVNWTSKNTTSCGYTYVYKLTQGPYGLVSSYHGVAVTEGARYGPLAPFPNGFYRFSQTCYNSTTYSSAIDRIDVYIYEPLAVSCVSSDSYVPVDSTVTWTTDVTGGNGPYTYKWKDTGSYVAGYYSNGTPIYTPYSRNLTTTKTPLSLKFDTAGYYQPVVSVTSADGQAVASVSCTQVTIADNPPEPFSYLQQPIASCGTNNQPSITFSWTRSLYADGYMVFRHNDTLDEWADFWTDSTQNKTTFTDTTAAIGTTYSYFVMSYNNWGMNDTGTTNGIVDIYYPSTWPAFTRPVTTPASCAVYSLSGSICINSNNNDTCDAGEVPYKGSTSALLRIYKLPPSVGPDIVGLTNPVTSNNAGKFSFTNVPNGTYWLDIAVPTGHKIAGRGNNSRPVNAPQSGNFDYPLIPQPPTITGCTPSVTTADAGQSLVYTMEVDEGGYAGNLTYSWSNISGQQPPFDWTNASLNQKTLSGSFATAGTGRVRADVYYSNQAINRICDSVIVTAPLYSTPAVAPYLTPAYVTPTAPFIQTKDGDVHSNTGITGN